MQARNTLSGSFFGAKSEAIETVTFVAEADGRFKAAGYFIK